MLNVVIRGIKIIIYKSKMNKNKYPQILILRCDLSKIDMLCASWT